MRVLIAANGDPGSGPPPGPFDRIVAADGGAVLCRRAGLQPDLVVGDMDSLPGGDRASLAAAGSGFHVHPDPVNKDETDLELAVLAAAAWKPAEVVLWGIWGSRLDHSVANLLILAHPALRRVTAGAYANGWWARLVRSDHELRLDLQPGIVVSLVALTGRVTGIRTAGLQYPLPAPGERTRRGGEGGTLTLGSGRGVSNTVVGRPAAVRVGRGLLLVIYGPPEPGTAA
jgi:thiamine pyrophosphokinase